MWPMCWVFVAFVVPGSALHPCTNFMARLGSPVLNVPPSGPGNIPRLAFGELMEIVDTWEEGNPMSRSLKMAVLDNPSVIDAKVTVPGTLPDQLLGGMIGPLHASMMPGPP